MRRNLPYARSSGSLCRSSRSELLTSHFRYRASPASAALRKPERNDDRMTTDPRLWRRKVVYPAFSENVDQLDFQLYIVQIRISGDPFLFASTNPNILSLILISPLNRQRSDFEEIFGTSAE